MPEPEKKIFCSFRLSPHVLEELEALAKASKMDKTEIVESAIMHARVVVQQKMKARLLAIEELPHVPKKSKSTMELAVEGSSRAKRLAQESDKKQKAESPSGNKSSQGATG